MRLNSPPASTLSCSTTSTPANGTLNSSANRATSDGVRRGPSPPMTIGGCGRCVVLGNTVPSSIADCIGSPFKYAAMVEGTQYELKPAWDANGSYIEANWRDLTNIDGYNFIRVVGNATALEAAAVIKAVSQLRQRSDAYVITNSVRVEGQDMTMNTESIESIKAFDVMGAIYAELNEREIETVKELMK